VTLAELLHADMIPAAYVPSLEYQELRDLTRERAKLVWGRTRAECNIPLRPTGLCKRERRQKLALTSVSGLGKVWIASVSPARDLEGGLVVMDRDSRQLGK
jgi:hypothetical protein